MLATLRARLWWLPPALLIAGVVALVVFWHVAEHWLAHSTGSYNCPPAGCPGGSPHNYNAFSGSLSDASEITLVSIGFAVLLGWYHRHNCHTDGCWRIGKHPMAGGKYVVCRPCHNKIEGRPAAHRHSLEHIRIAHARHLARTAHRP